jgi:hypothetical protein
VVSSSTWKLSSEVSDVLVVGVVEGVELTFAAESAAWAEVWSAAIWLVFVLVLTLTTWTVCPPGAVTVTIETGGRLVGGVTDADDVVGVVLLEDVAGVVVLEDEVGVVVLEDEVGVVDPDVVVGVVVAADDVGVVVLEVEVVAPADVAGVVVLEAVVGVVVPDVEVDGAVVDGDALGRSVGPRAVVVPMVPDMI